MNNLLKNLSEKISSTVTTIVLVVAVLLLGSDVIYLNYQIGQHNKILAAVATGQIPYIKFDDGTVKPAMLYVLQSLSKLSQAADGGLASPSSPFELNQ